MEAGGLYRNVQEIRFVLVFWMSSIIWLSMSCRYRTNAFFRFQVWFWFRFLPNCKISKARLSWRSLEYFLSFCLHMNHEAFCVRGPRGAGPPAEASFLHRLGPKPKTMKKNHQKKPHTGDKWSLFIILVDLFYSFCCGVIERFFVDFQFGERFVV